MQFKSFKRKQINLTSLLLLTRIQDSTAHRVLNDSDQHLIRSTWNLVKRHSNQGPKAFLRHFDAKAAASSTQRSYDHPEGGAFISQASNCLSRLSFYLQQQQEQLGDKKPLNEGIAIKKCPALAKTLGKYNGAHREVNPFEFYFDMQMTNTSPFISRQKFNVILIDALEQELGDSLTSETKKAWEKVAKAMNDAIKLT